MLLGNWEKNWNLFKITLNLFGMETRNFLTILTVYVSYKSDKWISKKASLSDFLSMIQHTGNSIHLSDYNSAETRPEWITRIETRPEWIMVIHSESSGALRSAAAHRNTSLEKMLILGSIFIDSGGKQWFLNQVQKTKHFHPSMI